MAVECPPAIREELATITVVVDALWRLEDPAARARVLCAVAVVEGHGDFARALLEQLNIGRAPIAARRGA